MSTRSNATEGLTVVGIFTDRPDAEQAIRDLKDAGFSDRQIGVAMRDQDDQKRLIDETGTSAAEGAATGAVSGGVVGGLIGLLGSLLIPGVGPLVVGGVLASTLTGAGIGAATGGIIGALIGLGVPEEDAAHFDQAVRSGGVLVTVAPGDRLAEALTILQRHNVDFGPSGGSRFQDADAYQPSLAQPEFGRSRTPEDEVIERSMNADPNRSVRPVTRPVRNAYSGRERRRQQEPGYAGPERRGAMA